MHKTSDSNSALLSLDQPVLEADAVVSLHDASTARWHIAAVDRLDDDSLLALVQDQHRANFDLWHEEDQARSPDASDHDITDVKHHIDSLNQRRNDLVERIDEHLIAAHQQNDSSPLHSETPGLIIDRLSILALKLFHTAEEAHRETASDSHRERNRQRLAILTQQRNDLAGCLDALWHEVQAGTRRFRLYRQMKMYNDPELNPVLYKGSGKS